MILKKILRYGALALLGIVGLLIVFVLISVAPVDRTPIQEFSAYEEMGNKLNDLEIKIPPAQKGFSVGFGKINITPSEPMATAGYGKRRGKPYKVVHDSIFVRAMVVDNGAQQVAIVSADLLIMPPTVTQKLRGKLEGIGFSLDNTFLAATHSHNSIGQWGEGGTQFIYGPYEDSVVQFIADGIVRSIVQAREDLMPSVIANGAIAIPQAVENRLIDGGMEDPFLRVLEIHRSDSSKGVLVNYAAHATCLSQGTFELSRDYPGMVVDKLEENDYAFAMFVAGSVGSHKGSSPVNNYECMAWMSEEITSEFLMRRGSLQPMQDTSLVMERIPLSLSAPQVKVTKDLKLRSWLFRSAFGEYDAYLTVLRVGDLVMLGTPCDFSGEFNPSIDSVASRMELQAMVTSFNGGYIGYVTPERYYDVDHFETQLMNWYAPGTGEYVRDCLEKLVIAVSDTR